MIGRLSKSTSCIFAMPSLQGVHLTGDYTFPSPWNTFEDNKIFTSTCRCLIDLETKLVVLLSGDRLSVLEVDRKTLVPDGSEVWNNTCIQKLREILTCYSEADISRVRFPFFDKPGLSKLRTAITLYSPETKHMLFIAIYFGASKQTNLPKHTFEIPSEMTTPKSAPSVLVDCSKLCSIPINNDEMEITYRDWRDRNGHSIKLYEAPIREQIVNIITTLARDSPIIQYQDITRKFDVGQLVECLIEREGELCIDVVEYW